MPTSSIWGEEKNGGSLLSPYSDPLGAAREWEIHSDIDQRLIFPPEITATKLRSDLFLWSGACWRAFIIKLTVSWVDVEEERPFETKKLRSASFAAD